MAKIEYKVCVVTVTYGDRWKFLEQVLKRVLGFTNVSHVVVVNNASSYSLNKKIGDLHDDRIVLLNEDTNLGSAGGYGKGIDHAATLDSDFIWLLDDDNLPDVNSLGELLNKWNLIGGDNNKKALFCLRKDRTQHIRIAQGEDPDRFYLVRNNFLGFNIFRVFSNQYRKAFDKLKKKPLKDAKMPFVPYGGLLLHKSIIKDIGLPLEEFYLYVDDSEYTFRITENDGAIWLIPSCEITDIDKSHGVGHKAKFFRSPLLDNWNFRSYYHVRNMLFFNRKAIQNNFIFSINKNLYLTGLYLISICTSKTDEYKKLKEAIKDGLEGTLGKREFNGGS